MADVGKDLEKKQRLRNASSRKSLMTCKSLAVLKCNYYILNKPCGLKDYFLLPIEHYCVFYKVNQFISIRQVISDNPTSEKSPNMGSWNFSSPGYSSANAENWWFLQMHCLTMIMIIGQGQEYHLANFLPVTTFLKAEDHSTGNIYSSNRIFCNSICELPSMCRKDWFWLLFFKSFLRRWTWF